ncbi:glutamate-rich protein 3-like [Pogoniulus pusillus]|uniref:glutamate-rich protein 3-like n=1 Tax=Pogoniulus pusillus TaxID=488313 RepID=UPI0030B99B03
MVPGLPASHAHHFVNSIILTSSLLWLEYVLLSHTCNVLVTRAFLGRSLHLAHPDTNFRDEIKVYQQHCGGENLCVYKGMVLEGGA